MSTDRIEIVEIGEADVFKTGFFVWSFVPAAGQTLHVGTFYASAVEAAQAALAVLDLALERYREQARAKLLAAGYTPFAVEEVVDTLPTTLERRDGSVYVLLERRYTGRRHNLEVTTKR